MLKTRKPLTNQLFGDKMCNWCVAPKEYLFCIFRSKKGIKMKTLILSCSTGQGHNSCAKAIKEVYDKEGKECIIEDALSFVSRTSSKIISKGHSFIYRHFSDLFRFGYRFIEEHPESYNRDSIVHKYIALGKNKLAKYIDNGDFDVVICVHVFAAMMLTDAKKLCRKDFVSAFLGTDYTCSPTTEASDLDYYLIPDESLKSEFAGYGIPEYKLVASGIPIRQMFFSSHDKKNAKKMEGIDPSFKHLLVMGGSMGCGPIDSLVRLVSGELKKDEYITVVCGTNKDVQKKLSRRYAKYPNVHIRGYVNNVSRLLDSADLYMTKPGGISVTEAKQKLLPMIFVNAVDGCEKPNCEFYVGKGCAVTDKNVVALAKKCIDLMRNEEKLKEMTENFNKTDRKNSAAFIFEFLSEKAAEKNLR